MNEIERAYDEWASFYDCQENKTRDLEKNAAQSVIATNQYRHIVELGCGTGKNTSWLCKLSGKITAIDFSEKMLHCARKKITDNNVNFIKADLLAVWKLDIPLADLVTCSLVLEHIKNLDTVFKTVNKKLEINGMFFVCELHPIKQYLGSKARYEDGHNTHELKCFTHHVSDYLKAAENNDFTCLELKEWFDEGESDFPRLISFLFKL